MSVNLFQTNFPPQITPIVDQRQQVTTPWMAFFRALYLRTGESVGTPFVTQNNISAAGVTQATATPLISDWNNITTVIGGSEGVILPAMTMGQSITVFNNAGGNVNIYPPVGASLTVLGVATATNIPYVSTFPDAVIFYYFSDTDIIGI
jgi:hypothetical protein